MLTEFAIDSFGIFIHQHQNTTQSALFIFIFRFILLFFHKLAIAVMYFYGIENSTAESITINKSGHFIRNFNK